MGHGRHNHRELRSVVQEFEAHVTKTIVMPGGARPSSEVGKLRKTRRKSARCVRPLLNGASRAKSVFGRRTANRH